MWGLNEGCEWMYLGGVGHIELSEGFFGLTGGMMLGGMSSLRVEGLSRYSYRHYNGREKCMCVKSDPHPSIYTFS